MTGYFDDLRTEVRKLSEFYKDDDAFLDALGIVENRVIAQVNLVTGDREFPDDLREKIQGIIATKRVVTGEGEPSISQVREECAIMRSSDLLEDLHSAFHVVARRRHQTRFGLLSDSPSGNSLRRKDHDEGGG